MRLSTAILRATTFPLLAAGLAACGGIEQDSAGRESGDSSPDTTSGASVVRIVAPVDGASLDQGPVTVRFEVEGLRIVSAGTMDPGTGHHHLVVDTSLASWSEPIPALPGRFIHLGQGQTEFVLEGLSPGEHTVVAVVADGVHIPLDPPVADTVVFTVR